jgi:hypothetical protein
MKASIEKRLANLEQSSQPEDIFPRILMAIVPCGEYEKDDPRYSAEDEEAFRIYQETGTSTHLRRILLEPAVDENGTPYGRTSVLEPGDPDPEGWDEDA